MEKLILIGVGGYAKSVIDSVDFYNNQIETERIIFNS